jgi:hypothetical protein
MGGWSMSADRKMQAGGGMAPPRPAKSPSQHFAAKDKDEEKSDDRSAAALRVRLRGDLHVSGGASEQTLAPKLNALVATLASKIRSLSPGQTGHTTLRLTLDASGKVTRVAFVSGSLMMPSLKAELERLTKTWRFGSLGSETSVTFTLLFS